VRLNVSFLAIANFLKYSTGTYRKSFSCNS